MRAERFHPDVAEAFAALPLKSTQDHRSVSRAIGFGLLSMLAAAVILPLYALAIFGLADAGVRQQVANNPLVATEIALALAFWGFLFGWPLKQFFNRLIRHRSVEITDQSVAVADRTAFGGSTWQAPLKAYLGIAHHVRSSLSGVSHELVLVHPDKHKSVVLLAAEHISDADILRFSGLLNMPQIPAGELYRVGKRREFPIGVETSQALAA